MSKTKISFNVHTLLWERFKEQTDSLFLARAPFLDYVLSRELEQLCVELQGLRLSSRGKRYIIGLVGRENRTSINIEVRRETADALRRAMRTHNLVRDAFMNRLLLLLRGSDALLSELELPLHLNSSAVRASLEAMPLSPLGAMESVRDDPLYYMRWQVEETHGCGLYRLELPSGLQWATCFLPDERVPNTKAHAQRLKRLEML